MTAIINGSSPTVTFSDGTTQATSAIVSGYVPYANLPAGSVLQVIQTVKSDTFTTTSASYTDVTGLSVSITPKFATSKILVLYSSAMGTISGQYSCAMRLVRNSTGIYLGDAANNRTQASNAYWSDIGTVYDTSPVNGIFLDSPATTSATTYKLQVLSQYSVSVYINRNENDGDTASISRVPSQITVMEIAA